MTIHLLAAELAEKSPALASECMENRVRVIEQILSSAGFVVAFPLKKIALSVPVWEARKDDNGNTYWMANSPYHNDGDPMVWCIRPQLRNDRIIWVDDSTPDLMDDPKEPKAWDTLVEAKEELSAEHQSILEIGKREKL